MESKQTKYTDFIGRRLTKALFYETNFNENNDKAFCLYTLKREDFQGYPSLYRLYMEMSDLTEYEFANAYFQGWDHWKKLTECSWFIPILDKWREELDMKVKAKALRVVQEVAGGKGNNAFQANKMLIDRSWEQSAPKAKRGQHARGRPSNAEVKGELKRQVEEQLRIDDDYERIIGATASSALESMD